MIGLPLVFHDAETSPANASMTTKNPWPVPSLGTVILTLVGPGVEVALGVLVGPGVGVAGGVLVGGTADGILGGEAAGGWAGGEPLGTTVATGAGITGWFALVGTGTAGGPGFGGAALGLEAPSTGVGTAMTFGCPGAGYAAGAAGALGGAVVGVGAGFVGKVSGVCSALATAVGVITNPEGRGVADGLVPDPPVVWG